MFAAAADFGSQHEQPESKAVAAAELEQYCDAEGPQQQHTEPAAWLAAPSLTERHEQGRLQVACCLFGSLSVGAGGCFLCTALLGVSALGFELEASTKKRCSLVDDGGETQSLCFLVFLSDWRLAGAELDSPAPAGFASASGAGETEAAAEEAAA